MLLVAIMVGAYIVLDAAMRPSNDLLYSPLFSTLFLWLPRNFYIWPSDPGLLLWRTALLGAFPKRPFFLAFCNSTRSGAWRTVVFAVLATRPFGNLMREPQLRASPTPFQVRWRPQQFVQAELASLHQTHGRKGCHVFGSTTQVGLTQVLGRYMQTFDDSIQAYVTADLESGIVEAWYRKHSPFGGTYRLVESIWFNVSSSGGRLTWRSNRPRN